MTTIVDTRRLSQTDTGGQAGTILEPALACSGKRIMVTGNWFCSRSTDGGDHGTFIDPYTEFPAAGAGFCCDQLGHYCASRRLWIWLLQYSKATSGNLSRVAVSSSGKPGTWTSWATAPTDIDDQWAGTWLDSPALAESEHRLLLSFNLFRTPSDRWQRALVLRLSLDQ